MDDSGPVFGATHVDTVATGGGFSYSLWRSPAIQSSRPFPSKGPAPTGVDRDAGISRAKVRAGLKKKGSILLNAANLRHRLTSYENEIKTGPQRQCPVSERGLIFSGSALTASQPDCLICKGSMRLQR